MKRNPVAKSLRSPSLAPKIIRAKKGKGSYDRAEATQIPEGDDK